MGKKIIFIGKGVEIRLIHAKEPGQPFREDFDRYPRLHRHLERVLCPRVHFKCIIIDGRQAYFGSANLTGAGMGAVTTKQFCKNTVIVSGCKV